MIDRNKLIVGALPFILLFIELSLGLVSHGDNGKTLLCLFLAFWMVLWWVFEIMPLGVTALLPLFYFPLLGILPIKEVTPSYSNPVIFLFLGGFIIARAMEKTHLDERIALNILKRTGKSDRGIVVGFIIATGFLSMWISNTATTVMMVPIALSVTHFLKTNLEDDQNPGLFNLNVVLFLSIAYSANVGGIVTPVGTPPNVVFMGYLNDLYSRDVDFYLWMAATLPLALILLGVMYHLLHWLYPYKVNLPSQFSQFISEKLAGLGAINAKQRVTLTVFFLAAFLWIFKGLIHYLVGFTFINDTSVAIFCGFLLFFIPAENKGWHPVLNQKDINLLPWNIVLLFGGGMALANGLKEVGLIQAATDHLGTLDFSSNYILIVTLAGLALFLTEIMSNVALCVVALPLIMKLGEAQGLDPLLIALPAALCTSFAFSMPVSTPPNAIVFGTQTVTVRQMLKAGLLLNLIALSLTATAGYWLIQSLLL